MAKSRDAFRTISEVGEALDTPAHVLRFWESKFTQIKPVKRAGGRRYYRPDDLALLAGIKTLLHSDGLTIKGAQKLLREKGVKHVIALGNEALETPFGGEDSAPVTGVTAAAASKPVNPPADHQQSDLFQADEPELTIKGGRYVDDPTAESEIPDAEVLPNEAPPPPPRPRAALPANPVPRSDLTARVLAKAALAKPKTIKANAAQIAPLLDRLEALRDEMRLPW